MKTSVIAAFICLSAILLFTGCVAAVGSGPKTTVNQPSVGQQLIDLQNAKNAGAITEAEYQQQKSKLLEPK